MIDRNKIPEGVFVVLNGLIVKGFESYICGGAVRDLILGRTPKDFDVCTSATPEQVKELFPKTFDTGLKHGTVTVLYNDFFDNYPIEVTTFRSDGEYLNGRHPETVEFVKNVRDDVLRRDFSINGLLYDGEKVVDLVNGLKNLDEKLIRAIGHPASRFYEDALRMIRAVRFACQLNFKIDKQTYNAIISNAKDITKVSSERIRDELCKILMTDSPARGIELLAETGLLQYIIPELQECVGFDQKNPHHHKDVFRHILKVLDSTPKVLECRLGALFHDIAKPKTFSVGEDGRGHFYSHHIVGAEMTKYIMGQNRLKFDNETVHKVFILVKYHMSRFPKLRDSSIKKILGKVGLENMDNLINLQIADIIGSTPPYDFSNILDFKKEIDRILNEKEPFSIKDMAINGRDLIALGMKEGKEIGKLLNELFELVLARPEFNTHDKLTSIVKSLMNKPEAYHILNDFKNKEI